MALIEKPFVATKRIIRSIFRGRPNLFTDVDVNRQFEAMTYYINQSSRLIGSIGKIGHTISGISYTSAKKLAYDIRINPSRISVRGVDIDLPNTRLNGTGSLNNGTLAIYLVGREKLVTFEEDPELSGVNSPDFQVPLAGADTLVYDNISIVAYEYPTVNEANVTNKLGAEYKLITILGSIVPVANASGELEPRLLFYTANNTKDSLTELVGRDVSNSLSIQEQLNNLIHYLIGQKKSPPKNNVGMTSFYTGPTAGIWDLTTGLGLTDGWEGWAIMDGRNGTTDMRGKYMRGVDLRKVGDEMGTLGERVGSDEVTLQQWHIPPHKHHISDLGNNYYAMVAPTSVLEKKVEYDSRYYSFQNGVEVKASNLTGSFGNGSPFKNIPASVIALPVQKIR